MGTVLRREQTLLTVFMIVIVLFGSIGISDYLMLSEIFALIVSIADVIQVVLLVVVIFQLRLAYRAFLADHERRKKQATFEFVNAVSDRFRSAINEFDEKHGRDRVVDINDYDDRDEFIVQSYLSEIERICAGVNSGVFDYDILKRMMSSSLIEKNFRFRQYIDKVRAKNPRLYVEFDAVVGSLKRDNSINLDDTGKIEYS